MKEGERGRRREKVDTMEGGGEEEEKGRKKNVRREEVWGERNGR